MKDTTSDFRVSTWDTYIGQVALKERLDIHIKAALARKARRLDAIFLHGPAGCGKTALAGIIAKRFGERDFCDLTMPITDKTLREVVTTRQGVLLLDEIHRATPKQQETLLTLVGSNYITVSGFRFENPDLTIIGATTEREKVIKPLYDRFFIKPDFARYSDSEMQRIAANMFTYARVHVGDDYALAVGQAAGGVPRRVTDMVAMARDLKKVNEDYSIEEVLRYCGLTRDGLTRSHIQYMQLIHDNHGPMGLSIASNHLQLSQSMLVDLEMLLIRKHWLTYEPRGRDLTGDGHTRIRQFLKGDG